jgi:outer membrane protein assembly factor BamB
MNAICILILLAAQAAEWPSFRGPLGDGHAAPGAVAPVEWSETRHVAWKAALPGRGRSSPVVLGGRILLTSAREGPVERKRIGSDDMQATDRVTLLAVCIDRESGKLLWERALKEVDAPEPVHWLNSWATPTPAVEPGRFICDFGGMGTWCLDPETGRTLWERVIPLDSQVGPGSSLLLDGDRLVLIRDGRREQYVAALDKRDGAPLWRTERPPFQAKHVNMRKSFSSPVIIEDGGRRQLLAVGPHWAAAYDPVRGTEIWRFRHGEGFSIGSVPVYGAGLVYFGTGCFKPSLVAVKADGSGDVTESHAAWRSQKSIPVMSSPLLLDGRLYWVSDEGLATCAAATTGEVKWQVRLEEAHLASPMAVAGKVYFFGRDGKSTVAAPGDSYARLAENRLEGTFSASPAAVGRALYLRSDSHLYRIEAR